MILIACVDNQLGMMFHHRRQSQDRMLRDRILKLTEDSTLWMSSYTAKQFDKEKYPQIKIDDNFPNCAGAGEYAFTEDIDPSLYVDKIEKIILYQWNCRYPADRYFNILLKEQWRRIASEDFTGFSHQNITEEVYIR